MLDNRPFVQNKDVAALAQAIGDTVRDFLCSTRTCSRQGTTVSGTHATFTKMPEAISKAESVTHSHQLARLNHGVRAVGLPMETRASGQFVGLRHRLSGGAESGIIVSSIETSGGEHVCKAH
jgi:hypothetical protein